MSISTLLEVPELHPRWDTFCCRHPKDYFCSCIEQIVDYQEIYTKLLYQKLGDTVLPRWAWVLRCVPPQQIVSLDVKYAGPQFRRPPKNCVSPGASSPRTFRKILPFAQKKSQKFRFQKSSSMIGLSPENSLTRFTHKKWGSAAPGESLCVLRELSRYKRLIQMTDEVA